jgi:hypothetical protein
MSENKLVQLLNQYDHEHIIMETKKVIKIKPITTGQMKAILQYEGSDDSSVVDRILDDIINGCVITEGFNVDDLTLQDRFDLLIGIRKVSKGSIYNFNIKCPLCGVESIQMVDLDKLDVIPFPENIDRKVKISPKLSIYFDFIRRGHQKQSMELVEKMKNITDTQKMSEMATCMYAFSMIKFETNVGEIKDISISDRMAFLDSLGEKAYEPVNGWHEKNNYGIKFKHKVTCKAGGGCKFEKEEDIPITGFFF